LDLITWIDVKIIGYNYMATEPHILSEKQLVLEFLQSQPDDITFEDIEEFLFLQHQIMKGLKDVQEGKTIPYSEFKEIVKSRKNRVISNSI